MSSFVSDNLYPKLIGELNEELLYEKRYIEPFIKTALNLHDDGRISTEELNFFQKEIMVRKDSVYIPRLVVVLGTKCSLRCKECNELIPHFKPQYDLDKDEIIAALQKILNLAGHLLICELIGGEPFLSNNLEAVLGLLMRSSKVSVVEITTNGTVLPPDGVKNLLKDKKVKIRISDYGELVKKDRIIEYAKQQGIKYQLLELGDWVSPGGTHKRLRNIEQLRKYYWACSAGYFCKALFGKKLFACVRASMLYALGYMQEKEYVSVDEDMTSEDIKRFLMKDHSVACDYCDIMVEDKICVAPAEQID